MISHRRLITPFVAALLLLAPSLGAQQQVTGRVVNSQTGASVSAVQVFIAGSGIGALSQQNGRYLLLNVPVGTHTLTAQRIGYSEQTVEVTVAAGATVVQDFAMSEEALGLDAIIVTGTAGGARQREVGTAVSRLDAIALATAPVPSLSGALQGQVAGLFMTQGGPQAGEAPNIALRGRNSVSQGDSPLIYVNGVRMYSRTANTGTWGSGYANFNPIAHLKAEDIERIEVVRGPAATTLYGTEASTGVIQIFTKRGSTDMPTQWDASMTVGANNFLRAGPKDNKNFTPPFGAYDIDNKKSHNPDHLGYANCTGRVTATGIVFRDITCPADGDWTKPAMLSRLNLSVMGGTSGFTYSISTHVGDEGVPIDGTGVGFGASSQFAPMDDDRVGFSRDGGVRTNFTMELTPTLSAQWSSSMSLNTVRWFPQGLASSRGWTAPMQRGARGLVQVGGEPATGLHFSQADHTEFRRQVMSGLVLTHTPSSNFDHRLTFGLDANTVRSDAWWHVDHILQTGGRYDLVRWEARTTTFDYGANLRTSLAGGDITSTSSAGFQAYKESEENLAIDIGDFPGPMDVPTMVSGARKNIARDDREAVINAGGYFQQVFGYRDYFFLTGGLRVDGNSAFGSGFGLQAYPKVSVSYVLSDMDFFPDWFDSFKLRGAAGEAGKAPGAFDAIRSWTPIVSGLDEAGFTPGALGDNDLGPERSREYELGFDASLYGGRVTAEVTAFRQTTYDALIPKQFPASLGFTEPQLTNVGTLQNQGAEISLGLGLLRNRTLTWNADVLVSLLKSEAIDLGGEEIPYGFSRSSGSRGWAREGFPIPAVFGTKVMNPDEIADPILESDQYYGPSYPTHTFGLRTSVTILNDLTIGAFGEYQGGAYKQCQTCQRMTLNRTFSPCFPTIHAQTKADAGDPSDYNTYPADLRAKCSLHPEDQRPDRWYEKMDFFRLRTVNLSYRLPDGLVPGTNSARLGAAVTNLWTISDYWGNDPEARSRNDFPIVDYHATPPYQTFTLNLNVTF